MHCLLFDPLSSRWSTDWGTLPHFDSNIAMGPCLRVDLQVAAWAAFVEEPSKMESVTVKVEGAVAL